MSAQRDQIVKRVVHSLEESNDPADVVRAYFDTDREVVLEAARQTLEATRDEVTEDRLAAVVDKELIEALRFPAERRLGVLPVLFLHRRKVAFASSLIAIATTLALVLL